MYCKNQKFKKRKMSNFNLKEIKHNLFNKQYSFYSIDKCSFPQSNGIFNDSVWTLNNFCALKDHLNLIKSQLEIFDLNEWSLYTKYRDPSSYVINTLKTQINPEILTQAWCKFYECLSMYPLISHIAIGKNELNSIHLCEAPGAFVSALNHYLHNNYSNLKWNWIANSLNPDYEGNNLSSMIPDKRLINYTRNNWNFCLDNTGDITKIYNYYSLVKEAKKMGDILLITADGSKDCSFNPGEQESLVAHLHYCEVITALTILASEGCLVIKIFTTFECATICLLYLLYMCFEHLHIFKPCTSKSGNSEMYVICINYTRKENFLKILDRCLLNFEDHHTNALFSLDLIPSNFISQVKDCIMFFMTRQIQTITDNIFHFQYKSPSEYFVTKAIKSSISNYFITKYNIKPIPKEKYLTNIFTKTKEFNIDKIKINKLYKMSDKIKLKFVIGKEISTIFHSEFCPINNLQQFQNNNKILTANIFIKLLEIQMKYDFIVNINYTKNIKENHSNLYYKFNDIVYRIRNTESVIIVGALFLTRFEAGILFLLLCCFSSIKYNYGIIKLENALHTSTFIQPLFYQIKNKQIKISFKQTDPFVQSILSVLPDNLLRTRSFVQFLQNYNCKTLNYFLKNSN